MKQTALQQLIDYATDKFGSKSTAANDLICQAMMLMKIEKQDIIEAYTNGAEDLPINTDCALDAEQYYTQTFKN